MGNRNRVTYAVQDVFVGSPLGNSNTAWPALNTIKAFNITGFTGDGDLIGTPLCCLQRLEQVQSFSYTFDSPKTSPVVLGKVSPLAKKIETSPANVQLTLSYLLDGINNESRMGLTTYNQLTTSHASFFSGLMQTGTDARNVYLISTKEGEGGIQDIEEAGYPTIDNSVGGHINIDDVIDPNSPNYNTLVFQNCYLNKYGVKFNVGEIATVDASYIGDNAIFYDTASGLKLPTLNAKDGQTIDRGEQIFIPKAFKEVRGAGDANKYPSNIFTSKDISLSITERIPSGINWLIDTVQSCEISFDISRDPGAAYLGYELYTYRPAKLPVKGTISMSLLTSGNVTGDFLQSIRKDSNYDLKIDCNGKVNLPSDTGPDDTEPTTTQSNVRVLSYQISGARLLTADYTSSIGANKSTSLNFEIEIDFDNPHRNFWVSGNVKQNQYQYLKYTNSAAVSATGWLVDEAGNFVSTTRSFDLFPVY